jgi:hypothetical protein
MPRSSPGLDFAANQEQIDRDRQPLEIARRHRRLVAKIMQLGNSLPVALIKLIYI